MCKSLIVLLFFTGTCVHSFVSPSPSFRLGRSETDSTILQAKGFGENPTPKSKPKSPPTVIVNDPPVVATTEDSNPYPEQNTDLSMGKMALERMRRERAEQRNAELRKVKEVQEIDAMLRESPGAGAIPERVASRMGKRMLPFVGFPLFGSMAAFIGFWYMATYRDMEFQPAMVATSTFAFLGVGILGITYSIMSASWDEDREGSFLGTDEFSKNVDNLKSGLSRSRENVVLREKARDISPAEFAALEQNDAPKTRQQSFNEKLGDDME